LGVSLVIVVLSFVAGVAVRSLMVDSQVESALKERVGQLERHLRLLGFGKGD